MFPTVEAPRNAYAGRIGAVRDNRDLLRWALKVVGLRINAGASNNAFNVVYLPIRPDSFFR